MSTHPDGTFSFGWNEEHQEFVLWKKTRHAPVTFISLADAQRLADTVAHVLANRKIPQ